MSTSPVDVGKPDEVDTGRLDSSSRRQILLIIAAVVAATEIVPFHLTFVGIAARFIGQSFPHENASQLTWLTTLYAILGGVAVPVIGKLSDRIGKKKIVVACLIVSMVGCAIDALTPSWPVMLLGRALQGLAFPAIFVSYGLIRDLMPRRYLNMAIALAGGGTGLGAVLGPLAGGVLTDHFTWRALFWFCVVWSLVTILPLALFVPETKLRVKCKIDWVGAALLAIGTAGVLIYLSEGGSWGWIPSLPWVIGGVVALGLFYAWELYTPEPIMDPKLLRSPRYASVLLAAFMSVGTMTGLGYVSSFLGETPGGAAGEAIKQQVAQGAAQQAAAQASLQMHTTIPPEAMQQYFSVEGHLPGLNLTLLHMTLYTIGMTIVYVIVSPLCGWLSTRIGLRRPYIVSTLAFIVAGVAYALFHSSVWDLAAIALITGLGAGAYLGTLPNMVVEAVPQEQQGVSAGMYGAFNSFGTAAASAAAAAVMAAHPLILHVNIPGHVSTTKLNTGPLAQLPAESAYTTAFYMFAAISAVAFVLSLFMRQFNRPATGGQGALSPEQTAEEPHP
ncbi:MFS transporter [Nocardia sp. CA2R105]|uniref:MFS transporter n=1 Tax=Nocardia coffeae TaxID=2873381 RepID=UPI001CA6A52E|nr:MFS transporter [Nocardia coffeae]MBY8862294.1 MFS transporter [Nocardia coffeae]